MSVAHFKNILEAPPEPKEGSRHLSTDLIPTTIEASVAHIASETREFPGEPAHLALTTTSSASLQEIIDANQPL